MATGPGSGLRTIGVRLRMLTGDWRKDTETAGDASDKLSKRVAKGSKDSRENLNKVATGAALVGAALVAAAGVAIVAAAKFDKQMSEVGAVANATANDMERLRESAIRAGAATVFSASEAAKAEAELAKAGVKTADILSGGLDGALALAAAGQIDLANAAEIAAAAMNSFGLEGTDVTHIADVLAAAANKSAAGVEDLGQGLQQVGLVANQAGLTLEETVGLLAALADRGLKGSDGATSLKTALQRLFAPTDTARAKMDELGVSFYDASGAMIGIDQLAGQLQTSLMKLAPAQRNAALQTLFGSDAIRAGTILMNLGTQGVREYVSAVNDQGAASDNASAKLNNLAGDVEQLKGSLETLLISGGEGAQGGLRAITQRATDTVNAFAELPPAVQGVTVALVGGSGAALLAAAGYLKVRNKVAEFAEELKELGKWQGRAGQAMVRLTGFAGRAALIFGGLQVATLAIASAGDQLNPQLDALGTSLEAFSRNGKLAGEGARLFGEDLSGLDDALATTGSGFGAKFEKGFASTIETLTGAGDVFDDSLKHNRERMQALDATLAQMVQNGHADEAADAFQRLSERQLAAGRSIADLRAGLPSYVAAQDAATKAAKEDAEAKKSVIEVNKDLGRTTEFATDQIKDLDEAWHSLNDTIINADDTMLQARDAIDEIKESYGDSGKALQGNSRAALENRILIEKAAEAAEAAAKANLENGGSIDEATKIMADFKDEAIKATGATGTAKDEVKKLADALFQLPGQTTIQVKLNLIANEVITKASSLVAEILKNLGVIRRWGGVATHAQVGTLRDANVYPAGSSPLYAFAEPATRGEAFIPKQGNRGRSMAILDTAASWYGASVVPGGGGWYGGGGGGVQTVVVDSIIRSEDGRVMHRKLTEFAVNTGRTPAALWPERGR